MAMIENGSIRIHHFEGSMAEITNPIRTWASILDKSKIDPKGAF